MKDKRIGILFLTIFIDLLGFGIVIPNLSPITKSFAELSHVGFSPNVAVGLAAGVFSIIQFIFAPIFGSLSDRIGRRPIILGSIIANIIGYYLLGIAGSFWMLMVARIVSGFGSANIAAAQAYIADITPPQERAKRMGIIGAAFGLGFVFGPFIGGELYAMGELAGGKGLYFIGVFTAVLCALNFILAWILLPESLVDKVSEYRKVSETFKGMVTVWRIDVIGELFLVSFIYTAAFSMMQTNASVLWDEKYHLKPNEIGYVFAMIGVFSAVVQGGLIGVFQKKLGIKKMLIWGCPMAAIGLTLIPLPPDATWFYPVQVIAVMFLAFANGLLMPSINSLVSLNAPPDAQGKILGLLQSMGSLARAIGPLISGFLYDYYSSLPYFGGGVLMMIAFVLALALSKSIKFDIRN